MNSQGGPRLVAVLPPRKVSEELIHLQERMATGPVTLRQIIYVLRGRAYMLLMILLALPFITPIPSPGLSTVFGLAIAFISLRLTLGQRPWLPKKFQRTQLPAGFFSTVIRVATQVIKMLEALLQPRLPGLTGSTFLLRLHSLVILIAALELLLPLPIPFSNALPAWAIVLTAGGLLERDGLAVLLGYIVFAASVAYFVFIGDATWQGIEALWHWTETWWASWHQ